MSALVATPFQPAYPFSQKPDDRAEHTLRFHSTWFNKPGDIDVCSLAIARISS